MVKNLPPNVGAMGSISGSGRYPEEGSGNTPQYSYMGNPTDRAFWRATVLGVSEESDTT